MNAKFSLFIRMAFFLMLWGAGWADEPTCKKNLFTDLAIGAVTGLKQVSLDCQSTDTQRSLIGYRTFTKTGFDFVLAVDPNTLVSEVLPSSCLTCSPISWEDWVSRKPESKYVSAIKLATGVPTKKSKEAKPSPLKLIKNAGVDQSQHKVSGYFLTVDLCPSKSPGLDEQIFKSVENALVTQVVLPPVPVGVSVSGRWLLKHGPAMDWLLKQDHEKRIHITWINHTLNHPFHLDKPLDHNFLLSQGVHLDREILGLESLLLERGLVPSVFFRFPGLIASEGLLQKLRAYMLIPLGTNAWMAKKEEPEPGSIILIHGNYNEELGVRDFLKWVSTHRDSSEFMEVSALF